MNKERAKQIMQEIKDECKRQESCRNCSFFVGHDFESYCVFNAEDNEAGYDGMPKDWNIKAMPNLK
jgi:hypothetical protein